MIKVFLLGVGKFSESRF